MEKAARKVRLSPRSATLWTPLVASSTPLVSAWFLADVAQRVPESNADLGAGGLLAIGLLAAGLMYALTSYDNARHKRLLREGDKAMGAVLDIETGRYIRLKLRYEYQGKVYEEWEPGGPQQGATGMAIIRKHFEKGETLEIYVDPGMPGNFVVYDRRRSNHVIIE